MIIFIVKNIPIIIIITHLKTIMIFKKNSVQRIPTTGFITLSIFL
jgi:hypothetical protein